MENLLEYQNWMNENLSWTQDGWLFVKGEVLENGKNNLFLFRIKNIQNLARKKKGGESGVPVYMAILYPEVYKVGYTLDRKMTARKVMPTVAYLQRFVGINDFKIGLNQNKTPNWRNTINENILRKVLVSAETWIQLEDWAEIPVFNP
jgi:hypothetical protein